MDPRFRGGDDAQQRLVKPAEAGIHSICDSWQLTLTESCPDVRLALIESRK